MVIKFLIKMGILTLILSLVLPLIVGERDLTLYTPLIFINIFPIVLLFRKKLSFKNGPFQAIALIGYYIIFIPFLDYFLQVNLTDREGVLMNVIGFINLILLGTSFVSLVKYSFLDLLLKKRRVKPEDLLINILTYIIMALVFGVIYLVINRASPTPVFEGIDRGEEGLYFYFQHIYFSFVTMTTLGYGHIYPIKFIGQILVIVEVLTGIILLNCILGIIIGSGIFHFKEEEEKKNDEQR